MRLLIGVYSLGLRSISIHAPREGCDRRSGRRFPCRRNFNPRTPRGVRHRAIGAWQAELEFQSTHPARGATPSKIGDRGHNRISIHAPREGCDAQLRPQSEGHIVISIHAPREGCDPRMVRSASQLSLFQSTHPARGATFILPVFAGWHNISIHAPREGCDGTPPGSSSGRSDFNPRTPRGVRLKPLLAHSSLFQFQSTHPARGATRGSPGYRIFPSSISIHAPREGCDRPPLQRPRARFYFNPRTPRGVRRHAWPPALRRCNLYFNPRTPRGVRLNDTTAEAVAKQFQSTHPARGATANFTKEQRVCLAQFAYLHKGKKAEHTKTNAPMLH